MTYQTESPLFRGRSIPDRNAPMMIIRRERAAISAMAALRAIGADPMPTHRLPNGLGYIAPHTATIHGPRMENGALDSTCAGLPWAS